MKINDFNTQDIQGLQKLTKSVLKDGKITDFEAKNIENAYKESYIAGQLVYMNWLEKEGLSTIKSFVNSEEYCVHYTNSIAKIQLKILSSLVESPTIKPPDKTGGKSWHKAC